MTDTPPKPKRRRWRWLVALITFGVVAVVAIVVGREWWLLAQQDKVYSWQKEAMDHGLSSMTVRVCSIPSLQRYAIARTLLARVEVRAIVRDEEDAETLLSMRPCPVPIQVLWFGSRALSAAQTAVQAKFSMDILWGR